MSVETMALVLHHSRAKGTAKLILLGIANHAGDGGAWPTVATLARYANVTERAVQQSVAQLVQAGELYVHVQAGGTHQLKDHQRPNRYDVAVSCPPACDRTAQHRLRDLPAAQDGLWITGVKSASPGEASFTGGVKSASPEGVKPASPKPSKEPSINYGLSLVPELTTAHATCSICSLTFDQCVIRARTSGHDFTPAPIDGHAELERVRKHYGADGQATT